MVSHSEYKIHDIYHMFLWRNASHTLITRFITLNELRIASGIGEETELSGEHTLLHYA